tara:strand:- start:1405 stop:1902 length:498 start_codon:yes stop_codon:yes gene_type:complete
MKKKKTYYPRSKIENVISKIKESGLFDSFKKYEICGSYRRGAKQSSDIDIVYVADKDFDIKSSLLEKGYQNSFSGFADQIYVDDVCVEFFRTSEVNYWLNVLFWTGSAVSNYTLKASYFSHGFLISPHGIYDLERPGLGKSKYSFKNEQEIYNLIGKEYIHPHRR